jgi:hypothetical protein
MFIYYTCKIADLSTCGTLVLKRLVCLVLSVTILTNKRFIFLIKSQGGEIVGAINIRFNITDNGWHENTYRMSKVLCTSIAHNRD